jgi:c-di-GMP-binding flagellar brake protein YcgR
MSIDDFRITSPIEILAMLRRLAKDNTHLSLSSPKGTSIMASLWRIDPDRGQVSFSIRRDEPQLDALVEHDEATAVGFLDSIKLQFDVMDLVLVKSGTDRALNGAFPREMYRFQRRNGFRSSPVATFRHPMIPDMQLSLRVLDVSIGGCALFLPNDVPTLDPGVLMNGVLLDLDEETRVNTALRLQHITSLNPDTGGVRLGCEMVTPDRDGQRALQRYIDLTQKRRRQFEGD